MRNGRQLTVLAALAVAVMFLSAPLAFVSFGTDTSSGGPANDADDARDGLRELLKGLASSVSGFDMDEPSSDAVYIGTDADHPVAVFVSGGRIYSTDACDEVLYDGTGADSGKDLVIVGTTTLTFLDTAPLNIWDASLHIGDGSGIRGISSIEFVPYAEGTFGVSITSTIDSVRQTGLYFETLALDTVDAGTVAHVTVESGALCLRSFFVSDPSAVGTQYRFLAEVALDGSASDQLTVGDDDVMDTDTWTVRNGSETSSELYLDISLSADSLFDYVSANPGKTFADAVADYLLRPGIPEVLDDLAVSFHLDNLMYSGSSTTVGEAPENVQNADYAKTETNVNVVLDDIAVTTETTDGLRYRLTSSVTEPQSLSVGRTVSYHADAACASPGIGGTESGFLLLALTPSVSLSIGEDVSFEISADAVDVEAFSEDGTRRTDVDVLQVPDLSLSIRIDRDTLSRLIGNSTGVLDIMSLSRAVQLNGGGSVSLAAGSITLDMTETATSGTSVSKDRIRITPGNDPSLRMGVSASGLSADVGGHEVSHDGYDPSTGIYLRDRTAVNSAHTEIVADGLPEGKTLADLIEFIRSRGTDRIYDGVSVHVVSEADAEVSMVIYAPKQGYEWGQDIDQNYVSANDVSLRSAALSLDAILVSGGPSSISLGSGDMSLVYSRYTKEQHDAGTSSIAASFELKDSTIALSAALPKVSEIASGARAAMLRVAQGGVVLDISMNSVDADFSAGIGDDPVSFSVKAGEGTAKDNIRLTVKVKLSSTLLGLTDSYVKLAMGQGQSITATMSMGGSEETMKATDAAMDAALVLDLSKVKKIDLRSILSALGFAKGETFSIDEFVIGGSDRVILKDVTIDLNAESFLNFVVFAASGASGPVKGFSFSSVEGVVDIGPEDIEKKVDEGADSTYRFGDVVMVIPAEALSNLSLDGQGYRPISIDVTTSGTVPDAVKKRMDPSYAKKAMACVSIDVTNAVRLDDLGTISVTVPLPEDADDDVVICYLNADGVLERMPTEVVKRNGSLYATFTTTHLSDYVMMPSDYDVVKDFFRDNQLRIAIGAAALIVLVGFAVAFRRYL